MFELLVLCLLFVLTQIYAPKIKELSKKKATKQPFSDTTSLEMEIEEELFALSEKRAQKKEADLERENKTKGYTAISSPQQKYNLPPPTKTVLLETNLGDKHSTKELPSTTTLANVLNPKNFSEDKKEVLSKAN